ncbi:MAG: GNAT family N-acetyltransferase [Nanoarchaeota archaeon]
MDIKKASLKDLKDIQKLNLLLFEKESKEYDKFLNCNWTFGKTGEKYFKKKILNKNNCAFVALENNQVVGYLVGGITSGESIRNLPKTAELENMFVLKEYRNLKVGSKLYEEFLKWCKNNKVKIIKVEASAQNTEAVKFYRSKGFNDFTLMLENYL